MTTYIFLNVPGHGHVNPTLGVAQELVRRGERVIFYLTEEFRSAVGATGATFRSYESRMGRLGESISAANQSENPLPNSLIEESEAVLPQVFERIRADHPDFILYDTMCLWGRIAARALNVPTILTRPNYASDGSFNPGKKMGMWIGANLPALGNILQKVTHQGPAMGSGGNFLAAFRNIDGRLAALCRTYGVKPFTGLEVFFGSEALNIMFIPKEFQADGDKFDANRFVFVGPSIQPRPDDSQFPLEKLKDRTTLYIALGTIMNDQADFYNMCFRAFKDEPWQVVLSIGKQVDPAALDAIPANFVVRPHVPQLEVLQYTSLFVTHCGMNSTMESLYFGVPMVGLPQQGEQMMTAQRIQELGLGTALDMSTLTVEKLHATVKAAISNQDFRKNAQKLQQYVRNAGGYQCAADAIQKFVEGQHNQRDNLERENK